MFGFTNTIPKHKKYVFFTKYEYDKVKIKDHYFTLPVAKDVGLFRENGQLDTMYKYRYGGYREFTVDTIIKFDTTEESFNENGI
jgi:hypothetical protein